MTSSDDLLYLIRTTPEVDLLLRSSFGFDIHRKHYGEGFRLASGVPLEVIAGESAGGAYFLCAERSPAGGVRELRRGGRSARR
ncbi:hypothetical protein ACGFYY_29835 [Streptomyces sp. NPDC048331]|uniref:hypothetical protein n=1 Tax=Streptomyces sp. NPDC048331 TaxID=3365534 RepID=UPI00371A2E3D